MLVRFNKIRATESDGPVSATHAPSGACGVPVEAAAAAAASDHRRRPLTTPGVVKRKCVSTQKSEPKGRGHMSDGQVNAIHLREGIIPVLPVSLEVLQAPKGRADDVASTLGIDEANRIRGTDRRASAPGADVTGPSLLVPGTSDRASALEADDTCTSEHSLAQNASESTSTPGVDDAVAPSAPGIDGGAAVLGTDCAAGGAGGCKRPAPEQPACSRAAALHAMSGTQAGLERASQRKGSADDYCDNVPSKVRCLGRGAPGAGLQGRPSRRKLRELRESQSGTETGVSAEQTPSTYLFREYPNTLEEAISLAMQEEFSRRQAKLHANAPRPARSVAKTGGPEPMDLSSATTAGQQQRRYGKVRCYKCSNIGHYARECMADGRAGRPTGDAVSRVELGHATLRTAAPSEKVSRCDMQDDKPNLVILNTITPGIDGGAAVLGTDCAAGGAGGCKRPAPEQPACSRAAALHAMSGTQAGLERASQRKGSADDYCDNVPSKVRCLGRGAPGAGLQGRPSRRKLRELRESQSGTETGVSAEQTQSVETVNVLTRTGTGLQYQRMRLENPPTSTSALTALPTMSWKRFTRDLYDGRIEQICILSDVERVDREAEELKQLVVDGITEGDDPLSVKTKKQRFEEQSWDSLRSSPYYEILREYKDVLPDEIPSELPKDKGVQHEIDLVPGTKYCVTRQWPLPREQVQAIDDFFESRRLAGQVRESKSPLSAQMFCVKKPQGGWRIVHAYNKLNDATIPAQTPIPRKDVIIDSMALSTIFSALDLRDGFYQILMRERDISLTAVSTPSGMLWEWLVMPQGLKNAPATFNRCVTHLLRSVRDFAPSYFDDVFVHSRAVNGKTDIEMRKVHLRKLLELMRKHKLYANLKKCIFGESEIPVLGCLMGKDGVRPDPEKVRVINEWPTPSNVKELRQFLGLTTYLHKYVENYAGKIRPLSQLLKKEAEWIWTTECEEAFGAVK
ncbi:Retrovirus-related Pol polyprotein from transposon 297 [Phytophthora citrophthora]|uniref:Retrovirus-related Pol polyprotein from transposon 297 n=1 Tax=Phytophthora citrophthora TaxID=4793 RepID=A0AAD9GT07_9STRA|nr:Retrovirus-related Pol polyprotein from transposon 297 [Phytophthora citrophthora]